MHIMNEFHVIARLARGLPAGVIRAAWAAWAALTLRLRSAALEAYELPQTAASRFS
jgi:hypothetical protein